MRVRLSSRLGFLMLAAGCAVGLGNVWRFPFIVGQNGGAAFVLLYLVFLALLGFPILLAELAIGRGGENGIALAMKRLGGSVWGGIGAVLFLGNVLLMIYYTDVGGWLLRYACDYATRGVPVEFGTMLHGDMSELAFMGVVVIAATLVCLAGVKNGVERVVKWMMLSLFALMAILVIKALTLDGAAKGLAFYLKPDFSKFIAAPGRVLFDAMSQAFFTLSVGIGAMTIFGSYIDREQSLVRESICIIILDTIVAIMAGMVIFPACATYDVPMDCGPGLIFVALPKVFAAMSGGRFWGAIFFLFLTIAALTTVIAVFECIIGGIVDLVRSHRQLIALLVGLVVFIGSLPCVFFDGALDVEDGILSGYWLPLGGLCMTLFVSYKFGWGWEGFRQEASAGKGIALPVWMKCIFRYFAPIAVLIVVLSGILSK